MVLTKDPELWLVELQIGETIDTLKNAIKNNSLVELYSHQYPYNFDYNTIILNYIKDQQFEKETNEPILYIIKLPMGEIIPYNYTIIDFDKGIYNIKKEYYGAK